LAILDADKEGFLRSETSLIQIAGRTARNVDGMVIMYANEVTGSMKRAIAETNRRRKIQMEYNKKHGITPKTIEKEIREMIETTKKAQEMEYCVIKEAKGRYANEALLVAELEREMMEAAKRLEFEKAAAIRDEIKRIKDRWKEKERLTRSKVKT